MGSSSAVPKHNDPLGHLPVYSGPLGQLIHQLTGEARGEPGEWFGRRLAKGAVVVLKVRPDSRRQLQLQRRHGPITDVAQRERLWQQEINIFLRLFLAQQWEPVPVEPLGIGEWVTAAFLEPPAVPELQPKLQLPEREGDG